MTSPDRPEIPTPADAMLARTRRRIEQLRRRRRSRRIGVATVALVAAVAVPVLLSHDHSTRVVNVVGSPPVPSSAPLPRSAAAPTTTARSETVPATTTPVSGPATVAACATAELRVSLARGNGGAAGSFGYRLVLGNVGSVTCTLTGYPGVSYVDGPSGGIVGAPAQRDHVAPVAVITIAPGQAAQSTLIETDPLDYDPGTCRLTDVAGLRVYPPNQTVAAFVTDATHACSNAADPVLQVGPVEAATGS